MNDFLYPSYNKIYEKEPRYREQILPVPSTEALRKIDTKRIHKGIALLVTCYVTETQQR